MDKISKLILSLKYKYDDKNLNILKKQNIKYSFLIDLPIVKHTKLTNEMYEVISNTKIDDNNKDTLFINLDPSDLVYNHFLRCCFSKFFDDNSKIYDIVTYENKHDLKENLKEYYIEEDNKNGDIYFFSSIFTDSVFEVVEELINKNNYSKIIFHWRGYFLFKLLKSENFLVIKDKLTVLITHLLDFDKDVRNINITESEYYYKLNSIKRFYTALDIYYTFPKKICWKNMHISRNDEKKFKVFIWWKSNRDNNLIKLVINKLTNISNDFEFVITSDQDFSWYNVNSYKYLQYWDFLNYLKWSNLNLILNKNLLINSWDATLLHWYAFWVPGITNTISKYSRLYINNWYNWFLIKDNNIIKKFIFPDSHNINNIVKKIMYLKDNFKIHKAMSENAKSFYLSNLTTEWLVEKIYNNL